MSSSRDRAALAVVVTLVLFVLARIRRIGPLRPGAESASSPVTVTPPEETELPEVARVLGSAFATEAFTATAFGGPIREVEGEYEQAIELLLHTHVGAGQPVFVASTDGDVDGVAVVSRPGVSSTPLRLVWQFARHLSIVVRLLQRVDWAGLHHVARTARPPEGLPSPYYRLEAIGVSPDVQGEGVGRALLDATHDLVEQDPGASGIYLFTGERSTRTLYERVGYETVATKRSGDVVAYHMFRPNAPDRRVNH